VSDRQPMPIHDAIAVLSTRGTTYAEGGGAHEPRLRPQADFMGAATRPMACGTTRPEAMCNLVPQRYSCRGMTTPDLNLSRGPASCGW
jgi:hypothetical protein